MLQVFLCHSTEDKKQVLSLFRRLRKSKFDPWLDKKKLLPGHEWDQEIRKEVHKSEVVLICLSNGSLRKEGYVQREIKLALDVAEEKPDGTIFIIPVRLEECGIPQRLRKWQCVDYLKEVDTAGCYKHYRNVKMR